MNDECLNCSNSIFNDAYFTSFCKYFLAQSGPNMKLIEEDIRNNKNNCNFFAPLIDGDKG